MANVSSHVTHHCATISLPAWKVEARAIHAVTWLPLARHTHTGRFGELVLGDQHISIDQDPAGALAELHHIYCENSSAELPELPPPPELESRPARRRGLYFCPFHPDEHASLQVYTAKGHRYCPLPERTQRLSARQARPERRLQCVLYWRGH
jgi:hypothetical protein